MTDTIHEPRGIQMKLVFSDDERGTIDQHQTNCVTLTWNLPSSCTYPNILHITYFVLDKEYVGRVLDQLAALGDRAADANSQPRSYGVRRQAGTGTETMQQNASVGALPRRKKLT